MINRIKRAIARALVNPAIQSVIRHALTAAVAVFIAAISVGGFQAVNTAVVVAAAAAALRVIQIAVVAYFSA